jgi:hypothetical protein
MLSPIGVLHGPIEAVNAAEWFGLGYGSALVFACWRVLCASHDIDLFYRWIITKVLIERTIA